MAGHFYHHTFFTKNFYFYRQFVYHDSIQEVAGSIPATGYFDQVFLIEKTKAEVYYLEVEPATRSI